MYVVQGVGVGVGGTHGGRGVGYTMYSNKYTVVQRQGIDTRCLLCYTVSVKKR